MIEIVTKVIENTFDVLIVTLTFVDGLHYYKDTQTPLLELGNVANGVQLSTCHSVIVSNKVASSFQERRHHVKNSQPITTTRTAKDTISRVANKTVESAEMRQWNT